MLWQCAVQCLVPLWDALNHVTGQANVRLAHDAEAGGLQMIATRSITRGEELINDYGPLSNGELLRRCAVPSLQLLNNPQELGLLHGRAPCHTASLQLALALPLPARTSTV